MIKASAGGGGKGMRIARDDGEAREGFASARNEARSAFGDERIFIEKFIEAPRHIEIQVLADGHGKVIHLGERECSIQRRHQKVIEEAPSPLIDAETRARMGAQAVALAEAVDYRSAGTVEFIVDKNKNFYFIEMNTRIQVEHPVTEMVTGLDLVASMIRIAAGEPLSLNQDDIALTGWALECRVYAEDPLRGFMPSTGRLVRYRGPETGPRLRIDSGVNEGSEITMFYDPMIAKVVTHGETRDAAVRAMQEALDGFTIRGIRHNMNFLAAVMAKDRFRDGRLTTGFIAEEFPDGFQEAAVPAAAREAMIAVAALVQRRLEARALGDAAAPNTWVVRIDGEAHQVALAPVKGGTRVTGTVGTCVVESDWQPGMALFRGPHRRPAGRRPGRPPWARLPPEPRRRRDRGLGAAAPGRGAGGAHARQAGAGFVAHSALADARAAGQARGRGRPGGQGRRGAGGGRGDEDGERAARRARRRDRPDSCGARRQSGGRSTDP